jgi:hypothetical protein
MFARAFEANDGIVQGQVRKVDCEIKAGNLGLPQEHGQVFSGKNSSENAPDLVESGPTALGIIVETNISPYPPIATGLKKDSLVKATLRRNLKGRIDGISRIRFDRETGGAIRLVSKVDNLLTKDTDLLRIKSRPSQG